MAGEKTKGRRLKEFQTVDGWNDEQLYPAELELLHAVRDGKSCQLGPGRPTAPDRDENFIRAEFLRFLILGGDDDALVHDRGVRIRGGWIDCPVVGGQPSLDLDSCSIRGDLVLWQCHLDGTLVARGCKAKTINLAGSSVERVNADGLQTTGGIFLRDGFTASGTIRLPGAKIGGDLDCSGATLNGEDVALYCDRIETTGGVYLRDGFTAAGTVRLLGAKIGGDLACRGGRFDGSECSIACHGAVIRGQGFFDSNDQSGDFLAGGTIDLTDARFEKSLFFDGAILSGKDQAITAPGLKVEARLSFNGAQIAGPVSITSASIGGDVTTEHASFERGLTIDRTTIEGILFWRNIGHFAGRLSLDQSHAEALSFDTASWAGPGKIELDGFTYQRFQRMPEKCDADYWVDQFVGSQHQARGYEPRPANPDQPAFNPHAHGQLAKVLTAMGYEEEARAVNIDRRRRLARSARQRFDHRAGKSRFDWVFTLAGLTVLWT